MNNNRKPIVRRKTILETVVVLYVILFLYTGISKLEDHDIFKEQLAASPVLSPVAKLVALLLPWIEFLIAVLLIVPRWRLKGLYASVILMTLFTIYILSLLAFSDHLPCSCGGIIELLSWKQHLFFNTAFIALGIWALIFQKLQKTETRKKWTLYYT